MSVFQPIKKTKAVEQVAEAIRTFILEGGLVPGQKLPSERDLAVQFEVNRGTVREAIGRLEALGLVRVRHGGATEVSDFLVTAGLQLLPFLIAPGGRPNWKVVDDLLDMRAMLLDWTAKQAAIRCAEQPDAVASELKRLDGAIERLAQPGQTMEGLKLADFDFFEGLVRITENRVLSLVISAIRRVYFQIPDLFDALYDSAYFSADSPKRIVEALRQGDAESAQRWMRQYVARAKEAMTRTSHRAFTDRRIRTTDDRVQTGTNSKKEKDGNRS
ncbi:MAG: FadR family transcriptional regulator [Deltaproteobacteria bacterium]|nr:FadR family transcriptional regulator [Deltaproteobacteria bacterium]